MAINPDDIRIHKAKRAWKQIQRIYAASQAERWSQWHLKGHSHSAKVMQHLDLFMELEDYDLPGLISYAAVLNYFFAEFKFTEQERDSAERMYGMLDCWDDPKMLATWDVDTMPDDWYLYTAESIGLTKRMDWKRLDQIVRWINEFEQTGGEYVTEDYQDRPNEVVMGKILCNLI